MRYLRWSKVRLVLDRSSNVQNAKLEKRLDLDLCKIVFQQVITCSNNTLLKLLIHFYALLKIIGA